MKSHSGVRLSLAFVFLAACAGTPVRGVGAPEEHGASFEPLEDEVLHDLALVDGRFARRAHLAPSEQDLQRVAMAAMLHEDPSVAVVDGAIDPFSFDARLRGLDTVRTKEAALPLDPPHASERELLVRVVDSETARLDDERKLPRSASALVRAVVDGWRPPRDAHEAGEDDRWLAGRLALVRASMKNAPLDVVRARDLDDALDALEGRARGLTATTQEILHLRDALEEAGAAPAAGAASTWELVGPRVEAELGPITVETLARELAATEKSLRERAVKLLGEAWFRTDADLFAFGPCIDAVPGSRVRSLAASPEREAGCHLRHVVATTEVEEARVLATLLDHVVVAEWALDVARGTSTLAHAEGEHHLLMPALPHVRSRYERVAVARPVAAIVAGVTAQLLADAPGARAKAWATLGDVPLDVARRELLLHEHARDGMTSRVISPGRSTAVPRWASAP